MDSIENDALPGIRDERPESSSGDVAAGGIPSNVERNFTEVEASDGCWK